MRFKIYATLHQNIIMFASRAKKLVIWYFYITHQPVELHKNGQRQSIRCSHITLYPFS